MELPMKNHSRSICECFRYETINGKYSVGIVSDEKAFLVADISKEKPTDTTWHRLCALGFQEPFTLYIPPFA